MIGLIIFSAIAIALGESQGTSTDISSYPYTASVRINGNHRCAGAIISEEYALTSVSCLNQETGALSVRVGSSYQTHEGQTVSIEKVIKHPKYNETTSDFDLALLKFYWRINFGSTIDAVVLPEEDEIFEPQLVGVVTTWSTALIIKKLEATTVSQKDCRNVWSGTAPLPDGMDCAYVGKDGMDACFEDFGSPLVVNEKLFGVSSLHANCEVGLPRMYASAVAGRKFIKEVAGI